MSSSPLHASGAFVAARVADGSAFGVVLMPLQASGSFVAARVADGSDFGAFGASRLGSSPGGSS